eukprot:COSAG01_NODE_3814_length_5671_cov_3.182161_1_plen_202_part_00
MCAQRMLCAMCSRPRPCWYRRGRGGRNNRRSKTDTMVATVVLPLLYSLTAAAPAAAAPPPPPPPPPATIYSGSSSSGAAFLDMYSVKDCNGSPNMTIQISSHVETLCTGCWDRCAWQQQTGRHDGFPSMRLRGPGKIAVNGNCIGRYAYAGGWSDATLGGVFSAADGCHNGGASAVILCSGTIRGIQDVSYGVVSCLASPV